MRRETIEFKFEMDKAKASKHVDNLRAIGVNYDLSTLKGGDTLKVTYTLNVSYLQDTDRALDAVERMMADKGLVVACSNKELRHGRCLFDFIMNKIRSFQRILS